MPKQVRLRRGTTAQHATFTGADGEVTFDTTKKALVLHDGVTAGGKPLEGFLVLTPGNPLVNQTIASIMTITGGDSETNGFAVVNGAEFNHLTANASASVRWLHLQQEGVPYASNVTLNFQNYTTKRITLTGNITFSATGMGFGNFLVLRILCDGTGRNFTWPAGWKWVGSAAPPSIAANKTGLLQLWCFGTGESDVVGRWEVEA